MVGGRAEISGGRLDGVKTGLLPTNSKTTRDSPARAPAVRPIVRNRTARFSHQPSAPPFDSGMLLAEIGNSQEPEISNG